MLFMVAERSWGHSFSVVRAIDEEQAKRLAGVSGQQNVEVIRLDPDGRPGVLWSDEYSPDSRRDSGA